MKLTKACWTDLLQSFVMFSRIVLMDQANGQGPSKEVPHPSALDLERRQRPQAVGTSTISRNCRSKWTWTRSCLICSSILVICIRTVNWFDPIRVYDLVQPFFCDVTEWPWYRSSCIGLGLPRVYKNSSMGFHATLRRSYFGHCFPSKLSLESICWTTSPAELVKSELESPV